MGDYRDLGAPQSRNEAILMNMLGASYTLEDPQSRIEYLLQEILNAGGGGSGEVTGVKGNVETEYRKGQVNITLEDVTNIDNGLTYDDISKTLSGSQHDTMPTASADWAGKTIQYTGPDTPDYESGHFYKCEEDAGNYAWEEAEIIDTLTQSQLNTLLSLFD